MTQITAMLSTTFARIEAILFSPYRRTAALAQAGLLLAGALLAALLVGVAGPIIGTAALVAVVLAVLILRSIRWGFVALFAVLGLLPFGALPFKLGFTPTFLDVALLAVYFVWIMRIVTRQQEELDGSALGVPVLFFVLLSVAAFANGMRYSQPTVTAIRNFAEMALGILFFFVLVNTLHTQADLDLVTRLIILAGAAAAAIAVFLYVIPQNWTIRLFDMLSRFNYPAGAGALRYIEDDPANPMRAIGTQVDPNVLGGLMILIVGLTAPQLMSKEPVFPHVIIAGCLGAELLALYLTYSRGSLLGLAIGLVLVGLLRYRKLLLIAMAGAALLLLLPQAAAYVTHLIEGLQLQDKATQMRLGEYRDALALISRYPWFGVGFAGSPDADLYVGVSSLYLLMAEEMGVIGVAAFLIVIAGFFAQLWQAWHRAISPRMEALLLGLGAAVTGAMAGGFLDHYLFNLVYPHMAVYFWSYLGLGMAAVEITRRRA
jgi:O-antigen ligase